MSTAAAPSHRALAPDQIDQFNTRGFVSLGRVLDDDTLAQLRAEYDRLFAQARTDGNFRNLAIDDTDDTGAKNEAAEQMLQIMQMCERSLVFRRLLYNDALLDRIEDLIGPNIMLFHDQALFKPAHHGGAVFWHQDNAYWQCQPANLVSCWITLDDVDASNGAMHLIPGSHLVSVQHDRSASTNALLDLGDQIDPEDAEVVELPAGGARPCITRRPTPPSVNAGPSSCTT